MSRESAADLEMEMRAAQLTFTAERAARDDRVRGFTLVEILIVVVILGILAAIVVPNLTGATTIARENTLKDELRYLRSQVLVYRAQHRDIGAGTGSGDFLDQMTMYTDEIGDTSSTKDGTHRFGPYLSQMPSNPITSKNDIKLSSADPVSGDIDDTTGWVYNAATLQIAPNMSGVDSSGTPYSAY